LGTRSAWTWAVPINTSSSLSAALTTDCRTADSLHRRPGPYFYETSGLTGSKSRQKTKNPSSISEPSDSKF
jgi:hypothetical protein